MILGSMSEYKILLLGEYSGFYKNLAIGFHQLGHEVTFVSDGHYGHRIFGDMPFPRYTPTIFGKIRKTLMMPFDERKLSGYDAVCIMDPTFIRGPKTAFTIEKLKANNNKLFLSVPSSRDANYLRNLNEFEVHPHMNTDGTINMEHAAMLDQGGYRFHDYVVSLVDGIIPISPGYAHGYQNIDKPTENIPLPIDTSDIEKPLNEPNPRAPFHVFHGVYTSGTHGFFKGTPQILEGIKLAKKEGLDFKLTTDIIRPFAQYLTAIQDFDVLIDQTKSCGIGMNSIIGLSRGLTVLTRINDDWHTVMGTDQLPPVINVTNNADSVASGLHQAYDEWQKGTIIERMEDGRNYIKRNHSSHLIAERYINFFSKC